MSWRRILLFSAVFALLLGAVTWTVLARADAVTALLRERLDVLLRPPVELREARVEIGTGRLELGGLRIADPTRPGVDLLRLEQASAEVAFDPLGSLVALHRVGLRGLVLDLGPALPALHELLEANPAASADDGPGRPPRLPHVELTDGQVRHQLRAGTSPLELRDLTLTAQPSADAPGELTFSGTARLVDLDATLAVTGRADVVAGWIDVAIGLRDTTVGAPLLQRLRELFDLPLEDVEASCRLQHLTARLRIGNRGETAPGPRFEIDAECADVHARAPLLQYPLRGARVRLQATDADGGTASVQLTQQTAAGAVEVLATARLGDDPDDPHLEVRLGGRDVALDADVRNLLGSLPVGRRVLAALEPHGGRADLELYLRNPQRRGDLVDLDLTLRDVAMAYHGFGTPERRIGFPLPLQGASGRVVLRDDILHLEDLSARIAAGDARSVVRLSGRIDTRLGGGEEANLDIRAEQVPFGPELRAALQTLLRDDGELYDRLAPAGAAAVEVLVRPRSQLPGGWAVTVELADAAVQWAGFPLRLDQVRGTVVARDAGVNFDLSGRRGDGRIGMTGRIPLANTVDERLAGFEALVHLERVAIDDTLRDAAAVVVPEIDAPWRACRPTGRLGGEVRVWRATPDAPLEHDLRIDCDDVRIELPAPPWYAAGLSGQVFAQGKGSDTRIDFDALRGRIGHGSGGGSPLALLGSIDSGKELRTDLTFVVRELQLDGQLGATLEALGAIGQGTWAALRPNGSTDLVCRYRHPEVDGGSLELVAQLLDVGSNAPILPKPARRMTGELTVRGGVLRFDDVRADLGGAEVRASGGSESTQTAPAGRTANQHKVESDSIPLGAGVAHQLAEPQHRAIRARELAGRADVDALQLRFLLPNGGSERPFETTIAGQLRLDGVGVTLGVGREAFRIDNLQGFVRLDESTVGPAGGGLRGGLDGCSVELLRHRLEGLHAGFAADAEQLVLHSLRARLDGGIVQNGTRDSVAFAYLLPGPTTPEGRLRANLDFENVDVYAFLSASGWVNPPYSGIATGRIQLDRLDGADLVGALAEGELSIERGDLGVVPLFTAIYAQLPAPERPRFDRLRSKFRLAERRVFFDDLGLWSNLLAAQGKGTLDLDGYLDVELKLDNLLGPSADPVLMPLVSFFTQNIVRFHLFGPLRDLRAEKRWLTEASPRRREALPMPPFRGKPTLPDF